MAFVFYPTFTRHAAVALAAVVLAGCASIATTPEAVVKARATQQWQARITGDLEQAYTYTPPSYRAATTLSQYKKGFGNATQVVRADVTQVKCETQDKCVASAKLEAKVLLVRGNPPPLIMYYDEVWIRENGQWWLFPTP